MKVKNIDEVYLFHLEKAFKQFKKYKNATFKKHKINITDDQWILLKIISEKDDLTQAELARQSNKEPASVTRILDTLEKNNWIQRKTVAGNRRIYHLAITKEGSKLVKTILPIARKIRQQGLINVSDKKHAELIKTLDIITENFKG